MVKATPLLWVSSILCIQKYSLGVNAFFVDHEVISHLKSEANGIMLPHRFHHAQLIVLEGDNSKRYLLLGQRHYRTDTPERQTGQAGVVDKPRFLFCANEETHTDGRHFSPVHTGSSKAGLPR